MRAFLFLVIAWFTTAAWAATLPGQAAFDAGDFDTARSQIKASAQLDESPAMRLMLARIELAENGLDAAEKHIDKVLVQEPENVSAHTLRGQLMGIRASRASMFKAGKFARESQASLNRALELDPTFKEALVGIIQYRLNAPKLLGGSVKEAQELAERLAQIDELTGKLQLASIYGTQKKEAQQVSLLKQLVTSHPNDPRAPLALGFLYQSDRDWALADSMFKQAAASTDEISELIYPIQMARYQIGRTAVRSKTSEPADIEEAIVALTAYLDGPRRAGLPDLEWAHYRRGMLYERLDDRQAEADADYAVAAQSDDRDLQRALASR